MPDLTHTHTYVTLPVPRHVYSDIETRLRDAGYDHVFGEDGEIDMHGLALTELDPTDGDANENIMVCSSLYGQRTQQGRVQMTCGSKDFTMQLSVAEARELATNILNAASCAESDEVFASWCRASLGLDERAIAGALLSMRAMRPRS